MDMKLNLEKKKFFRYALYVKYRGIQKDILSSSFCCYYYYLFNKFQQYNSMYMIK